MSTFANYTTHYGQMPSGGVWNASATAAGYTNAFYSGMSDTVYRWIQGYNISQGQENTITQDYWSGVTYLAATYTFSSLTYSSGQSNVSESGYDSVP